MLHWLQTTAHFCANLPCKRKRKKISINFLHIRILVFRFARKVLFLVPSKNRLLLLAVQPPLDTSAVLSNLDVRTCHSVKGNRGSTDWWYSVVHHLEQSTACRKNVGKVLHGFGYKAATATSIKRRNADALQLTTTRVIQSVCPMTGRCSAHAYGSSLSPISCRFSFVSLLWCCSQDCHLGHWSVLTSY
jgi:hypothetical protein